MPWSHALAKATASSEVESRTCAMNPIGPPPAPCSKSLELALLRSLDLDRQAPARAPAPRRALAVGRLPEQEARDDPQFLELLAWYALAAYGESKDRVREVFAGAASTRGEEAPMNAIKEIELEAEAKTLLRQIEGKFGTDAKEAWRVHVEKADKTTLERWLDRILSADRVEDIFE